jgi:hypothetical protein
MATFDALSQGYSTRRNVPCADTTTALRVTQSKAFLVKQGLANLESGGTMSSYARPAASVFNHVASSDGSTVSTVTDLWTSTFNAAKLVMAAPGAAHSWWCGQNATHQVLIDLDSASAANGRIALTPIAHPFNTGSATVSAAPTSAGWEWNCMAHNEGAVAGALFSDTTISLTHNMHFVAGDDGQFYFMFNRVGSAQGFSEFFWFGKATDAASATSFWFNSIALGTSTRGQPSIANVSAAASVYGRNTVGTLIGSGGLGPSPAYGGALIPASLGTDIRSGKYMAWKPEIIVPAPVFETLGTVSDFYFVSLAPIYSPIPSVAATQRLVAGDCVIPWTDGAPTP